MVSKNMKSLEKCDKQYTNPFTGNHETLFRENIRDLNKSRIYHISKLKYSILLRCQFSHKLNYRPTPTPISKSKIVLFDQLILKFVRKCKTQQWPKYFKGRKAKLVY
jgi:hypothetical protein